MKKTVLIITGILLVLAATYFVGSGFTKNGSAYIDGYSVSDDGKELTVNIVVASSAGHIRKLAIRQQEGGKLYIDCYSAFGGVNGGVGAKSVYTLPLDESTATIAFYRSADDYEELLQKAADGVWRRAG